MEAVDGNRQLLLELIDIFHEECPKLRQEIGAAIAAVDLPGLRRAVHTLRRRFRTWPPARRLPWPRKWKSSPGSKTSTRR